MLGRLGAFVLVLGACHVGSRAETFAPAKAPAGVSVTVALRDQGRLEGELLTVSDTALLVLSEQRVFLVPGPAVRQVRLAQRSDIWLEVQDGKLGSSAVLAEVRLVSRFPQGLTPVLLRRLLGAYGQTAPDVVSP